MKKILFLLIITLLIIPSITLAHWWNPFSWFDNWKFFLRDRTPPTIELGVENTNEIEENNNVRNQDPVPQTEK
ncbi:MAG TPA: hypothetical protein PKA60_01220 [Candidatus Paceibacterota bacterium]|nr:hypothetical protein [Candidatus Paceibacterota bacterium]